MAYRALADLAETVEDEWQYVTDLTDAYLPSIRALGGGTAPLPVGAAAAVDEAIAEIGLISDPHRAIDWLSTFPHVVAIALGGDVEGPEPASAEGTEAAGPNRRVPTTTRPSACCCGSTDEIPRTPPATLEPWSTPGYRPTRSSREWRCCSSLPPRRSAGWPAP